MRSIYVKISKKEKILFCSVGTWISCMAYVYVRMSRWITWTTPVASSFIPPSAIHAAHRLHYRCTCGAAVHMKQKPLENESDVKLRSDWFTSEGHFAPDSHSTCRIYHRKSSTFRSRGISALPSTFFRASIPKISSLPDFVKSTGITTLVRMSVTLSRGPRLAQCQEIVHRGDVDTQTLSYRSRRILFYRASWRMT